MPSFQLSDVVLISKRTGCFLTWCFFVLFISCSMELSAQRMTIVGIVQDTSGQQSLQHAVVMAVRIADSLLTGFTRSDKNGSFKLDSLPVDTYQVIISHPLFGDKDFIILGKSDNRFIDFKKIILPPKSYLLNEVTILGYADPVYYKGDTLVYTADSFNVKNNAVVEDLLKKLPGIKVDKDGKIFSQGKAVDQVLVDGDEFFGSDPTIATKNLSAKSIESVQVYDKKNDNTSEKNDNETLKVMNLQLKDEAKKGYFGKVSAAGGLEQFYEGELLLNKFKGKQKISLFALGSNTPHGSFGWNEIYEYGLDNERNSFSNDDGSMFYYSNNNQTDGIPQTYKTGFYYTDQLSKKNKVSLNYSYDNIKINSESSTTSQYFLTDTTYKTKKISDSHQQRQNQSINLSINHKADSLTEIEIQSKFKYTLNDQERGETNSFISAGDVLTRTTTISNSNYEKSYRWNNSIRLTRNFHKRDRLLVINYNLDLSNSKSDGFLKSDDRYFTLPALPADSLDERKYATGDKQVQVGSISYTEPIGKKIKLEFSYDISLSTGTQNKRTLDFVNGFYNTENPALTNNFRSVRSIQRIGTKVTYEVRKYSLSVGTRLREVESSNTNLQTQEKISLTIRNTLPYLTYRYKFSDNQSLTIRYSTNSRQPELNQLQPIPDNSNPNYIVKGNPDLRPTFTHSLDFSLYAFKPVSGKNIWTNMNFSNTEDAFANATFYDSYGRRTSETINVNGNYYFNSSINFTIPLFARLLELTPNGNFRYNHSSNFVDGQKNTTTESSPSGGLEVRYHTDTIEFSVGGSYAYNHTNATLNTQSNQSYTSSDYYASFSMELPWKMKLETDADYSADKHRTQGYNLRYVIWNASLSKTLLKNENLIASIRAIDLLNENINNQRSIQDNVISDVKTTIIGRYLLLKVVYKITSDKKKNDDHD